MNKTVIVTETAATIGTNNTRVAPFTGKLRHVRFFLSVATVLVGVFVGGARAWAVTSPETTTLGVVEYSSGNLLIQDATGNNFFGQLAAGSGCTANNQTIDTLKSWLSMSQAALLAAKNVRIYFNVCGGINYISTLDLDK
jgi:hypothetical protein